MSAAITPTRRLLTLMKSRSKATALRFSKLHGAGNDFVLLDLRDGSPSPSPALCRALANRNTGVGCDQILTIEHPRSADAVAAYGIYNSDGSSAGQCGNGARCVAAWLQHDGSASADRFVVDSPAGRHEVTALVDGHYQIGMGAPRFAPQAIGLGGFDQQHHYSLALPSGQVRFGAVSMGNPHAVLVVDEVSTAPVASVGAQLQQHDAFADSVNVGFAQVIDRAHIALRVYERGVGETLACGSGACAAAVVLMQQGLVERSVQVQLPGGALQIDWPHDAAEVLMSGPTAHVFDGDWLA